MLRPTSSIALIHRVRLCCHYSSIDPTSRRLSSQSVTAFAARKAHEQKVAKAQKRMMQERNKQQQQMITLSQSFLPIAEPRGLIKQKRGKQRKKSARSPPPLPTPPQQQTLLPADRHLVANTIQRWCSKDTRFFNATMEALNLSSLGLTNDEHAHPLSALVKQYRQLYFQSIPDFRSYLDTEPESLTQVLSQLLDVGFGDPIFSKQYRQVRRYEHQKSELERVIARQELELERQQAMLRQVQKELEPVIRAAQRSASERTILATYQLLRQEKSAAESISSPHDLTPESFSSTIISKLASWFSFTREVTSTSTTTPEDVMRPPPDYLPYFEPFVPPTNRSIKRVRTKIQAIESMKSQVVATEKELKRQQTTLDSLEFPLPLEDYEKAQKAIEESMKPICHELALQIRVRHSQLIDQYQRIDAQTDLTKPHEWFGYARLDQRKIIFHCGPTNSGKTYSALERLKEAERGLYLGPLRLLAAEIYESLTADGIYANLFTGQERREIAFSTHSSATVEMVNLSNEYDVVVIDEIQMISDATRGAAWTKALLGLRCKEIHVCGGSEATTIVKKLAEACGDEFELREYQRFSPLIVASRSMSNDPDKPGCYSHVQPGDCVVAFSRNDIFAIKREIELTTNHKCCVIYGKLPPQTRAEQARRFNDPDSGYDILVASDAIGMGLNLNIRRIIFNSVFKFNGEDVVRLSHSEIKQISGRAGRRNSPFPNGEVTCRDPRDLPFIEKCLSTEIGQIEKAALLPTSEHIELFSQGLQAYDVEDKMDLYQILRQFSAMATVKGDFFLGRQTEMQMIAKSLKGIPLSLDDAYSLCMSPTSREDTNLLQNFAWKLSRGEVCGLPSRSVPKPAKSFDDLSYLCNIYGDVDLFLWLQAKFPPSNAVEQQAALARKEATLQYINEALANTDQLHLKHDYVRTAMRHRAMWESENGTMDADESLQEEEDDDDDAYAAFAENHQMRG